MTTEQEQTIVEPQPSYSINLDWYQKQGRSFATLAASRLCPASRKKEKAKTDAALLRTLKQCCSKREDFITPNLPLMEVIFRLFLSNGNQPLGLEKIQEELQQRLGDLSSARDISIPKLKRMLDHDRYYGLRAAPSAEEK